MLYEYFYYNDLYSSEECRELLELSNKNKNTSFVDIPAKGKNLNCTTAETDTYQGKLKKFFDTIEEANQLYFGMHLYSKHSRLINCNFYNPGQNYECHRDGSPLGAAYDTKLTAILNISTEPYTGGEFSLYFGKKVVEIKQINKTGSFLVFPSFFYHEVNPIKTGQRITLSAWMIGPNWK
jgi:predicted 2-oxoglutarate/Fe(II)-dependent dioxygenase YbiX